MLFGGIDFLPVHSAGSKARLFAVDVANPEPRELARFE
jgi:hypothetical protein